ncbi:MAG TPA: YlxR family protein [Epulopiscium sp.]|nr:YlxR family protein [Candidatus Epulonipiscium sp.]
MLKPRKLPLRKCTGCQEMKDKREMIRVVKDTTGAINLDFTGKKSGRGAYVCPRLECLEKAEKSRGLERSFKMGISKEIYESLRNELTKNG